MWLCTFPSFKQCSDDLIFLWEQLLFIKIWKEISLSLYDYLVDIVSIRILSLNYTVRLQVWKDLHIRTWRMCLWCLRADRLFCPSHGCPCCATKGEGVLPEGGREYKAHYRCVLPGHLLHCRPLSRKPLRWWAARHNGAPLSESTIKTAPVTSAAGGSGRNTEQRSFPSRARYIHNHYGSTVDLFVLPRDDPSVICNKQTRHT